MADWGNGGVVVDTWGTTLSDPYAEKLNMAGDPWGAESNEPARDVVAFGDSGNSGDYNGVGEIANDKCFGCGEEGHKRGDCPNAAELLCRYCKKEGHMLKDCPDKPVMTCDNCGQEGHIKKSCENARKINRDHIADTTPEAAWDKLKQAASERDADDAREAVQEYVKALGGEVTYRQIQEKLMEDNVNLWLIGVEKQLNGALTNMNLQGNIEQKYTVSYRFSDKPQRPREINGWPADREEILSRLDDAGDAVDRGIPKCYNCDEFGHTTKTCTQDKVERTDKPKIACYNCNAEGHRVRDCPEPRIDKFACKNCGKSGHKASDCEEPPNLDNLECRKCNQTGHFAKDCPQGGGMACRNCGQEGHMAKECDQPRNMDSVVCRNCDQSGHYSRDCPKPKDWSKVQCSNCEEFGHTKVRCKQLPKESPAFGEEFSADTNDQSGGVNDGNWGATQDAGAW